MRPLNDTCDVRKCICGCHCILANSWTITPKIYMVLYHGDRFFFHVFNILLSSVESMPGTVVSARATMAFAPQKLQFCWREDLTTHNHTEVKL